MSRSRIQRSLERLDAITRRLLRDCPWDREQDERSIGPHTVEEAYELADAVEAGDDTKLVDELGDVLFQVHFLALLLEERGGGDLGAVAERCTEKLIRRHPHVFGDAQARTAGEVLRNWDAIKRQEPGRSPGLFADVPQNLPALLLARKVQRLAASAGSDGAGDAESLAERCRDVQGLEGAARDRRHAAVGELLFAAVAVARRLEVDPELALRAAARRFQARAPR